MNARANTRLIIIVVLVNMIGAGLAWGIEVLEPGYIAETYVIYTSEYSPYDIVFDDEGILYVTHWAHEYRRQPKGYICRIDTDRNVAEWLEGFYRPASIKWAGGTNYGEFLYLCDGGPGGTSPAKIYKVNKDGSLTMFASPSGQTSTIGIDRIGRYSGHLYMGHSAGDRIEYLLPDGSIHSFSSFPYNISGSPGGFAFTPENSYDGWMYAVVQGESTWAGLFFLDTNGNPTRFSNDIVDALNIVYDSGGEPGGNLFIIGRRNENAPWAVYRILENGDAIEFAAATEGKDLLKGIIIGPDGGLYVVEYDFVTETVIVSRISAGTLIGLEIVGPNEVAEDFQAQYKAIAHYDNGSTKDVTDMVDWLVKPNDIASIDSQGLLNTGETLCGQDVIISAEYDEGGEIFSDSKEIAIFPICPTGSALEFDGQNDYVAIGNLGDFPLIGSIQFWMKPDDIANYRNPFTTDFAGANAGIRFEEESSGRFVTVIATGPSGNDPGIHEYVSSGLHVGTWYHVALVWDSSSNNVKGYLDGVEKFNENHTDIWPTALQDIQIGRGYSNHSSRHWKGTVDEVAIYNRALSAEEIWVSMHTKLNGSEPNLVAYWSFDEGEGQTAGDLSPYANDGTLGSTDGEDDSDPEWVKSYAPVGICRCVVVDIKPGSCPNPLNLKSKGVLTVAILGSEDFDVTAIVPTSVRLADVAAIRDSYEDVAGIIDDGDGCPCGFTETGEPDGFDDLVLKFDTQEIVEALINSGAELEKGNVLTLELAGVLSDGTAICGADCVKLVGNVSKWLEAQVSDINQDGIIDMRDIAMVAKYWLESE